jgi:integrase
VNKGDRIAFRRMTDQAVLGIVRKRGQEAGVARFSPHDLRRTFVSDLLDAGADLSTTKRLAGHSSEATTGRYDRRGEEAKKKAAQLLHVPYVRQRNE